MKMTTAVIALGLIILSAPLRAQQIQNITVAADQPSYNGACPVKINFTATIHYSGTRNIQYTWLRSDGAHVPAKSLSLGPGGTATVTTTWQLAKNFTGWQALKITSPATIESPHANFSIVCNSTAPSRTTNLPVGVRPVRVNTSTPVKKPTPNPNTPVSHQ